ncbi:ATP-binding protein [Streptomyces sp. NPDC007172]|uniref:ATP-binding protein n=1 Tax=unclassified Streptomyces TaxID=2593676 RepID=UPI00369E23A5
MSLPLTRRIARAALLIAAGAAPVVGAAGSASAVDVPQVAPNLSGLTQMDPSSVSNAVDGVTQKTTGMAGETGAEAVKKAVPAAGKTVGQTGKVATPAAQKAAGDAAGSAGDILGSAAKTATQSGLPGGNLPTQGVPSTDQLPLKGLPLGS